MTHRECYEQVLNKLNEINFIIIRGFKYLPERADTDLDICIHPNSYNQFREILQSIKNVRVDNREEYSHNLFYQPFFTTGTHGEQLPGGYYRFDTYSDIFFYKNGELKGKEAQLVHPIIKKYIWDNKVKIGNYYIPNPISEIILLIYRCQYDKRGKWPKKHRKRIRELIKNVNVEEFNRITKYIWPNPIIPFFNGRFKEIPKVNVEYNVFIIRQIAMKDRIVNKILHQIDKRGITIIDKFIISIGDQGKFLTGFYNNFDEHKESIMRSNSNNCLVILTNRPKEVNFTRFKRRIRKEYIGFFPPLGNILHSSDSSNEAYRELEMLINEKINSFNNIGTYYSQKDN